MNYIKENTMVFLFFFCLTYTFFDVIGGMVSWLNKSGGGIIADRPSNVPAIVELANSNKAVTITVDVKEK